MVFRTISKATWYDLLRLVGLASSTSGKKSGLFENFFSRVISPLENMKKNLKWLENSISSILNTLLIPFFSSSTQETPSPIGWQVSVKNIHPYSYKSMGQNDSFKRQNLPSKLDRTSTNGLLVRRAVWAVEYDMYFSCQIFFFVINVFVLEDFI